MGGHKLGAPDATAAARTPTAFAPKWKGYAVAVVASVGTMVVRLLLSGWPGDRPMLLLFVFPILLAAFVGGLWPGILATVLVSVGTNLLILEPTGSLSIDRPVDFLQWVLLIAFGIVTSIMLETMRRAAILQEGSTADKSAVALRRTRLGFATALGALTVVSAFSLTSIGQLQSSLRAVEKSAGASDTLEQVVAATVDIESGQRGYLLTGDESYLEPFKAASKAVPGLLVRLHEQFAHDPGQAARATRMAELVAQRIAAADQAVALRRAGGLEEARQHIASGRGKEIQQSIRDLAASMQQTESAQLARLHQRVDLDGNLCRGIIALGAVLGVGVVAVALFLITNDYAETGRAQLALRDARDTLEARVEDRTRELNAALETIRNSEGRLAGVVNSAMDAIISVDSAGNIVLFNRAAETMFRCVSSEVLGGPLDRFLPDVVRGAHRAHMENFGRTGRTTRSMGWGGPLRAVRMDGQEFPIEASISQVVTGGVKLFTVIIRDVTERNAAEENINKLNRDLVERNAELDAERAQWKCILESIADEVWVADPEGHCSLINDPLARELELEKLSGNSAATIHQVLEVFEADGTPRKPEDAPLAAALRGATVRGEEVLRNPATGAERWRQYSAGPIRGANGRITGSVAVCRDITDQHVAEEAVRDRERQLVRVAENVPGLVGRLGRDLKFLYASSAWERLFPKPVNGDIRLTLEEVLREADSGARERAEEALAGRQVTFDLHLSRPDGEFYGVATLVPEFSATHAVEGLTILIADHTERHKAEAALLASEAQLRAFVEQAPVEMAMFDTGMVCLAASRQWRAVYGRGRANLVGLCHYDVHPDLPEVWKEAHRRGLAGEILKNDEDHWVREDGVEQWMRWAVHPWFDATGVIGGITVLAQDITERKRAEAELRASEIRYRHLLDNMSEGFQVLDRDLRYHYLNDAAIRHARRPRESLLGKRMVECYPGIETTRVFETITRLLREGGSFMDENFFVYPDGERAHFWLSIQSTDEGIAILSQDVTARKLAEEELIRLNHELEQRVARRTAELSASNAELEAFAYSVSHDLRAPLRAIDGFSRLLVEDFSKVLDSEGQRLLSVVRTNARQMDELITDLLSLSRIARSGMTFARVDMEELAKSIYGELALAEDLSGFQFTCGELPPAWGDAALLRQVWRNLLSNAVKYTRRSAVRTIVVEGRVAAGEATYDVRDSGIGFNQQYAHKLFQPFQRLHKASEFEGNGIGLAIVQRIVNRHGGRTAAVGSSGQGATISFTIPSGGS